VLLGCQACHAQLSIQLVLQHILLLLLPPLL
jgi:hypothetical protein